MYNKSGIVTDQQIKRVQRFDAGNGNSVWLPIEVQWQTNFPDYSTKSFVKADIEKTKVNPALNDAMFRVRFPPATEVYDAISDILFTIPDLMPDLDNNDISQAVAEKNSFGTGKKH